MSFKIIFTLRWDKSLFHTIMLPVFLLFFPVVSSAQQNTTNGAKKEINIIKRIINPWVSPSILIILPAADCYKCKFPLGDFTEKVVSEGIDTVIPINIVTNNYEMAREFVESTQLNCKITFNSKATNKLSEQGRSQIIVLINKKLIVMPVAKLKRNSEDILIDLILKSLKSKQGVKKKKEAQTHVKILNDERVKTKPKYKNNHFPDSNFLKGTYFVTYSNYGILLFDPTIQKGLLICNNKRTFVRPFIEDSLNFLPNPMYVNFKYFEELDFNESKNESKQNHLPIIHVKSIKVTKDLAFCVFSYVRFYLEKSPSISDTNRSISIYTSDFIAIKSISSTKGFLSLLDISSYDEYIPFDTISYKKGCYASYFTKSKDMNALSIADNHSLGVKLRAINFQNQTTTYKGVGNVFIADSFLKVRHLDTTISLNSRFKTIKYKNLNLIVSIEPIKSKESIRTKNNKIILNKNDGLIYLYDAFIHQNICYMAVSKAPKGIFIYIYNLHLGKIIGIKHLGLNYYPDHILFINKNRVLVINKEMINKKYNYGIISIKTQKF